MHEEHKKKDVINISISKLMVWRIISGVLASLLIISVFTGGFGTGSSKNQPSQIAQGQQQVQPQNLPSANQPAAQVLDMKDLTDDDAVKGDSKAPVTIVEWSDFQCPFCVRFYQQTLGQIEDAYIKTGKVKFIYRDYPLGFHENAQKAAESAECAGEQGKFWEMHDKLFEDGVSGGVDSFKQFAADLGLDATKFNDCLDNGAMASEVKKDLDDGTKAGIRGTPGFVINGKLVSGAQPFESFKAVIEEELKR